MSIRLSSIILDQRVHASCPNPWKTPRRSREHTLRRQTTLRRAPPALFLVSFPRSALRNPQPAPPGRSQPDCPFANTHGLEQFARIRAIMVYLYPDFRGRHVQGLSAAVSNPAALRAASRRSCACSPRRKFLMLSRPMIVEKSPRDQNRRVSGVPLQSQTASSVIKPDPTTSWSTIRTLWRRMASSRIPLHKWHGVNGISRAVPRADGRGSRLLSLIRTLEPRTAIIFSRISYIARAIVRQRKHGGKARLESGMLCNSCSISLREPVRTTENSPRVFFHQGVECFERLPVMGVCIVCADR